MVKKAKLCHMDTDIVYTKRDEIYEDILEDVETRLDPPNYELDRPLPKIKNTKSNWINERRVRWENNVKIC